MNNILNKLQQLTLNRLVTRLKHLRGRHDQLDHAWNRGMGRGGGGAALAPNQMGPLPTTDFYRQRRIELMEQQRQGQITNAEMRRQMRDLRGITVNALDANQSDNLTLANRRPVKPTPGQLAFDFNGPDDVKQKIDQFKAERDAERLSMHFDIEPFKQGMQRVLGGYSGVQAVPINGKVYYYRQNPLVSTSPYQWSMVRGPLKAIIADNIASSLGLPLAPIAQETNKYNVIANALDYDPSLDAINFQYDLRDKFNRGEITYNQLIGFSEPLAVMDLIIGQNDGHNGNINVIKNPNRSLYDSEYIATSVDYDLTGEPIFLSTALNNFIANFIQHSDQNATLLTPAMQELLTQFIQNPQWHPAIPERVQQQYIKRAQTILQLGQMTKDQLQEKFKKDNNRDEPLTIIHLTQLINDRLKKTSKLTNLEAEIKDASMVTHGRVSYLNDKIEEIESAGPIYFLPGRGFEFMSKALGFPTTEVVPRLQSLRQQLLQINHDMAQNISDAELTQLLVDHFQVTRTIDETIASWYTAKAMIMKANSFEQQALVKSPDISQLSTTIIDDIHKARDILKKLITKYGQDGKFDKLSALDEYSLINAENMINKIVSQTMAIAQRNDKLNEFLRAINFFKMMQFANHPVLNISGNYVPDFRIIASQDMPPINLNTVFLGELDTFLLDIESHARLRP